MRRHPFYILLTSCAIFAAGWQWGFLAFITSVSPHHDDNTTTITVLLWHWPFGVSSNLSGDVCWDRYRVPRCRLADQRSLYPTADVVVFHHRELQRGHQTLPSPDLLPRPAGQRWVWMSLESPENNGDLRPYAGAFNLTMSYRRDADIPIPYGEMVSMTTTTKAEEEGREEGGGPAAAANKSDLACWVVGNYLPHHRRSQVYKELSAVVPVRVYGSANGQPLPPEALLPAISRCYFYLAFENSVARDYITEKLWRNAYLGGAVPVVLGAPPADYSAVAPPGSFVHVDDFASAEELGRRLRQVAADERSYAAYFTWKRKWRVKLYADWRERLCRICSRYDALPRQKVYADLHGWVNS